MSSRISLNGLTSAPSCPSPGPHDPPRPRAARVQPVANLEFNFDYEERGLSQEVLRHMIYQVGETRESFLMLWFAATFPFRGPLEERVGKGRGSYKTSGV